MIALKLDYLIERAIIVFVCLWGNWALYYWLMVLVFDASFTTLKVFSPLLLLQICASLFAFLRTDFGLSSTPSGFRSSARWFSIGSPDKRFYCLAATSMIFAVVVVCAVNHYKLTQSLLFYNLVWALLLPVFLLYFFYFKSSTVESIPPVKDDEPDARTLDIVLLLLCSAVFAFNLYGTIVPTYDDGFYAGLISSTLANPDLPVQARDFLLNTSAPFTLHPAYRTVGYEVLIAFLSDISGINPLHLYFDIFPIFGLFFWVIAAYMFMRTLGVPYPGFAVTVVLFILLFWNNGFSPGAAFAFLCWGKYQLWLVAAPLLFVFVSLFIRSKSVSAWLILLLSVSTVGIWSSTAVFVAPLCLALASLVFFSSIKSSFRLQFYIFLSLAPIFFLAIYTVVMLRQSPVGEFGNAPGTMKVGGEAFGGQNIQLLLLVMMLLLPWVVRSVGSTVLQVNLYKICLVGIFTVMAPYFVEVLSVITGTQLLSERFQYSYPSMLLVGVMASIALAHVKTYPGIPTDSRARYAVIALALAFYGALFGLMEKRYLFGDWSLIGEVFTKDFEEAKAARALIPDGSFVAAGGMDDILPMFPNPPTFVDVKYYLKFHEHFLSDKEFRARRRLYSILQNRLPRKNESVEDSLDWIVSTSEHLGVTSIVFQAVGGRYRPYIFGIPGEQFDAAREEFVVALTGRLRKAGYDCTATLSGWTTVCNRAKTPV